MLGLRDAAATLNPPLLGCNNGRLCGDRWRQQRYRSVHAQPTPGVPPFAALLYITEPWPCVETNNALDRVLSRS